MAEYAALVCCSTYVIVDQDAPRAWVWARVGAHWPGEPNILEGLAAVVELTMPRCQLPLSDVYYGVQFGFS